MLAGVKRNTKRKTSYYDRVYQNSIANQYGVTISTFTRKLSNMLCDLRTWEMEIQDEILDILSSQQFTLYRQTMSRFGIGVRPQALLISQIYPITRFDSVGRFKRRLGMAKDEFSSGDKKSMNTGS